MIILQVRERAPDHAEGILDVVRSILMVVV